ncbi:hypothetical protein [Meiothermus sp.]|uniref:hypothetical protein n=1 Tax=Meiothermus sp. TaxID=1955249 RepID=UPI002622593B|nr:hypothetical protein [Meiothermus sp.]
MRLFWLLLVLAGGVFGLIRHVQTRPIERPPGVLAARAPLQQPLAPADVPHLEKPGYRFHMKSF